MMSSQIYHKNYNTHIFNPPNKYKPQNIKHNMAIGILQLGKQKVTPNFIETLKKTFEKNQTVKISVLPSARESKEDVKKYAQKILEHLGKKYTARIIGFTIILKKWRKERD